MPYATNDGVRLYYEVDGDGGPAVAFVGDVGTGAWLWSWQAPALAGPRRTVVWDARGTGRSDAPDGRYTVPVMAGDLEAVLADAGIRRADVVGAGLGGLVALEHAHRYDRASRLVLMGAAAAGDRFDAAAYPGGRGDCTGLLSDAFRSGRPAALDWIVSRRREEDATPVVVDAVLDGIDGIDFADRLHEITRPALVFHGLADAIVQPDAGRALADELPRGTFEGVEAGGHWFFVEQARLATAVIDGFLED